MVEVKYVLPILLLITALLFAPVVLFDFINLDDPYLVQNNADLLRPLTLQTLIQPVAGLYHPLTVLTYWIDAQLFGMAPGAFHVVNVLWHLLAIAGFWAWARRVKLPDTAVLFLAMALAWHPTRVESVAWISERKDVVAIALFWWALYAYACGRWFWCLGLAFLSLMGKPFAITLPLVIVWWEWWMQRQPLVKIVKQRWWLLLALVLMALGMAYLSVYAQGMVRARLNPQFAWLALRIPQQLFFYVQKTVWPLDLKLLYTDQDIVPDLKAWIAGGVYVLGVAWMSWRSREFRQNFVFGLGLCLITLAPMLKIVPFGDESPVADRYLYVSQIGLLWPWVMALPPKWNFKSIALWAGLLVSVSWAARAHIRVWDWRDTPSMWQSLLRVTPDSIEAHENLGRYYLGMELHAKAYEHLRRGQTGTPDNYHNQAFVLMRMGRLMEADFVLQQAEARSKGDPKVLNLRGNLYMDMGQMDKAEEYFKKSLNAPTLLLQDLVRAEALTNLGVLDFRRGRLKECLEWQEMALQALPNYVYALHNRAVCNFYLRRLDDARRDYQRSVEIQPSFAMGYNGLGALALQRGDLDEAEKNFRAALKIDPNLKLTQDNIRRLEKARSLRQGGN